MDKVRRGAIALACFVVCSAQLTVISQATANEVVFMDSAMDPNDVLEAAPGTIAQSRMPVLTENSQLPAKVKEALGMTDAVRPLAAGTLGHPFTTNRAAADGDRIVPVNRFPWSATGKLYMRFGPTWFICSASVIEKGLLVTAAHCLWNFGANSADKVYFEPARHADTRPFGRWHAISWAVPRAYAQGTDVCEVYGVVCENDIGVVVIQERDGKHVSERVGRYGYKSDGWGYVKFFELLATQITQLGYPSDLDDGVEMIRTDSLGYQATPNNVVIGSDQTGGSSGGPWIMNFGAPPASRNTIPLYDDINRVVATTSWRYMDPTLKVVGASRFAKNSIFTEFSNIEGLVRNACRRHPGHCDEH